ncbi:MAG: PKD domain-containing protein [Burkholderiales bacterium]|nr:PKD domain-containing protein [Burkholderiales bacterium]
MTRHMIRAWQALLTCAGLAVAGAGSANTVGATADPLPPQTLTITTVAATTSTTTQQHPRGTLVRLQATPTPGYQFMGWGSACAGTATACNVTLNGDRSVVARFYALLTVAVTGPGRVTAMSGGIACPGDCSEPFTHGSSVTLTASADAGQAFAGWGGACSGSARSCTVSITQARHVTATFTQAAAPSFALAVAVSGAGSVASVPAGIHCGADCSENYLAGTSVTLTATPAAGQLFDGWGGACAGRNASCVVTMTAARSVSAVFVPASAGAPQVVLQASRTSGVAPLAVMFDASGTLSPTETLPFHQLSYEFDFGDERGQVWPVSGLPRNRQAGAPLAAHVFDLPGIYTVRVKARTPAGLEREASVTVVVQGADAVFAGTATVCVSTSANFAECPAGAQQQTTLPTAYAGKRVLLRRGESFPLVQPRPVDAGFQVGAYGSGAKPRVAGVLTWQTTGVAAWASDFTVMDLDIGEDGLDIGATTARFLAYRNDIRRPGNSVAMVNVGTAAGYLRDTSAEPIASAIHWPREVFIVDNDIQGDTDGGTPNVTLMGYYVHSAILGNTIDRATEHSMRVFGAHKLQVAHNRVGGNHLAPNPPGIRAALKMQSSGIDAYAPTVAAARHLATRYLVIADNIIGSPTYPGSWLMGVGPENIDPGTQQKVEDVVVENNRIVRGPYTSQDIHAMAGRVTTRGNTVPAGGSFGGDMVTVQERPPTNTLNDAWTGPYFGQLTD